MAEFAPAVSIVLAHEGGYANDPDDPGGATKYGISRRFMCAEFSGDYEDEDIEALSQAQATAIYKQCWWDRYGYGAITDQRVATKVFDMAVNLGPTQAHKLLQRGLRAIGYSLDDDGIFGVNTLAAVNASSPELLINKLVGQQSDFYRTLARQKSPAAKFLVGWLKRAAWPLSERTES